MSIKKKILILLLIIPLYMFSQGHGNSMKANRDKHQNKQKKPQNGSTTIKNNDAKTYYCVAPVSEINRAILEISFQKDWGNLRISADSLCIFEPRLMGNGNVPGVAKQYLVNDIYQVVEDTVWKTTEVPLYYECFYFDNMNFNQAYGQAKNIYGLDLFVWKGKLYTTE